MTAQTLMTAFGWAAVLNITLFALTACLLLLARETIAQIHHTLFGLERQALRLWYFQFLAAYKLLILIFCIVPWFALKLTLTG